MWHEQQIYRLNSNVILYWPTTCESQMPDSTNNLYPWLWQTFHLVDSMLTSTQAIWRSRLRKDYRALNGSASGQLNPLTEAALRGGWWSVGSLSLTQAIWLYVCFNAVELQPATPEYQLRSGSGCCPESVPCGWVQWAKSLSFRHWAQYTHAIQRGKHLILRWCSLLSNK